MYNPVATARGTTTVCQNSLVVWFLENGHAPFLPLIAGLMIFARAILAQGSEGVKMREPGYARFQRAGLELNTII
jgi:hypothetical protein